MIIDTGLDGLDILFGPALSFCPFSAPSLRAHEIILLLAFPKFVKTFFWGGAGFERASFLGSGVRDAIHFHAPRR